MKLHFFFHHIMHHNFCITHAPYYAFALTIYSILHRLQSEDCHLLDMYIYTSLFTSIRAVCSHLFPSSAVVNIFLEIPAARSSIDVRWHHSGCSISSVHFKKTFSNAFSHLHINMNSTSTKQSPPNSQIWFTGHGPDHGQEGQPRR